MVTRYASRFSATSRVKPPTADHSGRTSRHLGTVMLVALPLLFATGGADAASSEGCEGGGFTVLGTLAKANGALLPVLALLVEAIVLAPRLPLTLGRTRQAHRFILLAFSVVPTIAIFAYLCWIGINGVMTSGPIGNRPACARISASRTSVMYSTAAANRSARVGKWC